MAFRLTIYPYQLQFRFQARTSRGAMQQHQVFLLKLENTLEPGLFGIGECAPLPGLSPDHPLAGQYLQQFAGVFNSKRLVSVDAVEQWFAQVQAAVLPSVCFALETTLLDYRSAGSRILFPTAFTSGEGSLPINGLIWMGDLHWMQEQIKQKIEQGYRCLKLKVGALHFADELALIAGVRRKFQASDLTIRLDANGGFAPAEALARLRQLAPFGIHSIEQPIRQGQWAQMAALCQETPVPVALDEELIGPQDTRHKQLLLDNIRPQYIILKPTLLGGLRSCSEWIGLAEKRNIPWWITSALESNIGLNAIAQYTATYPVLVPQGLGTGQLYHNNIASPLTAAHGQLTYDPAKPWDLSLFHSS